MRVDPYMRTVENFDHLATVPRCPGHGGEMKREHKCRCLRGKAVAITYSKVNEQHLEVPFLLFCFESLFFICCRYLKHTYANPEHNAFKKNILYCIV